MSPPQALVLPSLASFGGNDPDGWSSAAPNWPQGRQDQCVIAHHTPNPCQIRQKGDSGL